MMQTLKKYWFLAGLGLVFACTIFDPTDAIADAGRWVRSVHGPDMIIFLVFLIQGFLLNPDQIRDGLTDGKATLAAMVLIFVMAPLYAAAVSVLPISTGVLIGLFLVAVMPTTMSTGIVMTNAAGGNPAHALFVSVTTNAMATFTIAITLPLLLLATGKTAAVQLDSWAMILKIAWVVLLPLTAGIAAKAAIKTANPLILRRLSLASQILILVIVWIGVAQAKPVLMGAWLSALQIALLVLVFHLIMLASGFGASRMLSMGRGRRESVILMGAQKTLPLSIILQVDLFPEYGQALIVCVLHHLISLFVDGFLVGRMGRSRGR